LIRTCSSLEQHGEAFEYMKKKIELLISSGVKLDETDRNLFYKTSKDKISSIRNGWKNLLDFEQSEGERDLIPSRLIKIEMDKYENEIRKFCQEMIDLAETLEKELSEDDYKAIIFYKRLKGDYYRYYTEVSSENEFQQLAEKSEENYREAYDKCSIYLDPEHPLSLSVALNFSVFAYFILDDTKNAYSIADNIYRQAIAKINPDIKNSEVDILIKSLEENMTIWKIELDDNN
jgi:hypothetical protein